MTSRALFLRCVFLCFIAATGLSAITALEAGKPVPPPPPPPPVGTIYYGSSLGESAMKGDGSGKTVVLPAGVSGSPSDRYYGSDPVRDRWYICMQQTGVYDIIVNTAGVVYEDMPHYDVFAFRTDPQDRSRVIWVQLTDLYGIFRAENSVAWSNDSNASADNSHIGFYGRDFRGTLSVLADGTTYVDLRLRTDGGLRASKYSWAFSFPHSATEIDAAWSAGTLEAYRPDDPAEIDLFLRAYAGGHTCSPSGSEIVLFEGNQLLVRDTLQGNVLRTLWDGNLGIEPKYPANPVWSRDGQTINFFNASNSIYTTEGGTWSIPAGGGQPKHLVSNIPKGFKITRYSSGTWSPDSQHLLVGCAIEDPSKPTILDLVRLPAGGGTITNLTADDPNPVGGGRWVSDISGR